MREPRPNLFDSPVRKHRIGLGDVAGEQVSLQVEKALVPIEVEVIVVVACYVPKEGCIDRVVALSAVSRQSAGGLRRPDIDKS